MGGRGEGEASEGGAQCSTSKAWGVAERSGGWRLTGGGSWWGGRGEGAHLAARKDELKRRHGARVARTHVGVAVLVEHHAAAVGEQNVVRRRLAVLDRLAHHDACAGWGGQ